MTQALVALGGLGLASCGTDVCEDICTIWTQVEGTVTSVSGEPILGAQVQLGPMFDVQSGAEVLCERTPDAPEAVLAVTTESGAFSAVLNGISLLPPACVEIQVHPPGSQPVAAFIDTFSVEWSHNRNNAPTTTLQIQLVAAQQR